MSTINIEFLGNDQTRLGEVSKLLSNKDELRSFLKIVEDAASMDGSAQEKRESMLKNMLGNVKFRQYLKATMPELFKEGLKAERGNGWKMSMKDIAKASNATEAELLDPKTGWMGSDKPMKDLKFMLESEGLSYKDALKILQDAQTKKTRKDIYDDTSILLKTFFPRTSEAIKNPESFNLDSYITPETALDFTENVAQAIPMGRAGLAITKASPAALNGIQKLGLGVMENFTVPTVFAAADEIRSDDGSFLNGASKALTGGVINASAGKALKAGLGGTANAFGIDISDVLSGTSKSEALKIRLNKIKSVLDQGRGANLEDYKRALNEYTILTNIDKFRNKSGNLGDYALNTRKAKKVGKQNRKKYEEDLDNVANENEQWVKNVKEYQKQLEANAKDKKATKANKNALRQFTIINREQTFPHQFLDQNSVGLEDGIIRINYNNGSLPNKKYETNDHKIFDVASINPDNLEAKAQDAIAKAHKSSKYYSYSSNLDDTINNLLADPEFRNAVAASYNVGARALEYPASYITNKLGRNSWINRQRSALGRYIIPDDDTKDEE